MGINKNSKSPHERREEQTLVINTNLELLQLYINYARKGVLISVIAGFGYVFNAAIRFLTISALKDNNNPDTWGNLGDYLSGTAGLAFSIAGLLLVYMSFLGQKQQLLYQRLEIMNQSVEIAVALDALSEQNKTTKQQRLDSFFYQTLDYLRQTASQIEWHELKGVDAIKKINEDIDAGRANDSRWCSVVSSYVQTIFLLLLQIAKEDCMNNEQKKTYLKLATIQFPKPAIRLLNYIFDKEISYFKIEIKELKGNHISIGKAEFYLEPEKK